MQKLRRWDWLVAYAAGTAIVVSGVFVGREFVPASARHPKPGEPFLQAFIHWDANFYRDIARSGYVYVPDRGSRIVFFPAYPLACRFFSGLTRVCLDLALVLLPHLFFAAALFFLGRYVDLRAEPGKERVRGPVLLCVVLLPAGLFFRMPYPEALFFLVGVLELYLIQRGANPIWVALVAGLGSAVRPLGVAFALPLLWYLYRTSPKRGRFLAWSCVYMPVAVWGLCTFAIYCWVAFGNPLVFTHNHFWARRPTPPIDEKLFHLLTFEPVWSIFLPASPAYWQRSASRCSPEPFFNLYLANPLYFVASLMLLGIGIRKRWLNAYEILFSAALLGMPYWLAAYEINMISMARYVSVIFPLYIVAGRLFASLNIAAKAIAIVLSAVCLTGYAALFAQWYYLV